MAETTALGAAVAAAVAEGIALWDISSLTEQTEVSVFQPKLEAKGEMKFSCMLM